MPGNPLTKITKNLETAGWPYDPAAAANARWGMIPTTPAPKAVFDATNATMSLEDTNGHLNGNNSSNLTSFPNQVSATGGREWLIRYGARPSAYGDTSRELRYRILADTFENYHHLVIRQPENFYHRKCVAINGDLLAVADWVVGDTVTTGGGNTAKFFGTETATKDGDVIVLEDYSGQFAVNWGNGTVITNDRTGGTVTSTDSHLIEANNKLFHEWVDGEHPYSNGGLKIEYDAAGNGNSKLKPNASESYRNNVYFGPSNLGNDAPGRTNDDLVFDRADNGFDIEFVIGRKRSSAVDANDGALYLWKKSSRVGSPFENWQLLYMKENIIVWGDNDLGTHNAPTEGYMFGWANSGFTDETDFGLKYWGYWTQKPNFLTAAGV